MGRSRARLLAAIALLATTADIAAAFNVHSYTIPRREAVSSTSCDTVAQLCVPRPSAPAQDSCWLIYSTTLESVSKVRIYWWPRNASSSSVLREKSVLGRGGQSDTIRLPDSPAASAWLTVLDVAGNESCASNWITVNIPTTSVGESPGGAAFPARWYDISGRRRRELEGLTPAEVRERGVTGILFVQTSAGRARKIVVLR